MKVIKLKLSVCLLTHKCSQALSLRSLFNLRLPWIPVITSSVYKSNLVSTFLAKRSTVTLLWKTWTLSWSKTLKCSIILWSDSARTVSYLHSPSQPTEKHSHQLWLLQAGNSLCLVCKLLSQLSTSPSFLNLSKLKFKTQSSQRPSCNNLTSQEPSSQVGSISETKFPSSQQVWANPANSLFNNPWECNNPKNRTNNSSKNSLMARNTSQLACRPWKNSDSKISAKT